MHDFIIGNDFNVADLAIKQDVHYPYFNIARGVYNWIDHVLFTDYDMINVKSGKIIHPGADNVSDRLPLRLTMELHVCHLLKPRLLLTSPNRCHLHTGTDPCKQ